jgi:predicted small secreted protein
MRKKVLGIIFIVILVICSFVMTSCESPSGPDRTIKKEQLKKPPQNSR